MVKQEDILKALQEGADAQVMAQQFADALNAAIAQKNELDAKKNIEVKEKIAHMNTILEETFDFIDKYYPDFKISQEVRDEITAEAVIDIIDETEKEIKELTDFAEFLKNEVAFQKTTKGKSAGNQIKRPVIGDPITDFLKANGLA